MSTLSKSDFKVARTCAKKLVYRKKGYPNNLEENTFMKMLADGGYMIGALANLYYPGTEITGNTKEALEQTERLLQEENIVLHEAAIQSGQKLVRIDILIKKGNRFELIEVKSKSTDSENKKALEGEEMKPYIEDAVFQTIVLKEVYPEAQIDTYLMMPDKTKATGIEGLASLFKVIKRERIGNSKFVMPEVQFKYEGTVEFENKRIELIKDSLLKRELLNPKVSEMWVSIMQRSQDFIQILNNELECPVDFFTLNKDCKKCEYRVGDSESKNGFKECWGALADPDPHVFDLFNGGTVGGTKNPLINQLISDGRTGLYDFQEGDFVTVKGEVGSQAVRQLVQYRNTQTQTEWFSDTIHQELEKWQYPLHFIDFETYSGALPMHKGLKPYEVLAFQWSCHSIPFPGAEPIHSEWINTEEDFPAFRFAEALMQTIGNDGTTLMWSPHEKTVLRAILSQMDRLNYENEALRNWLLDITKDKDEGRTGRLIDMNAFALKHYFHPYMKGQTSIKKTLPAVWNHHGYLHQIPWFQKYYQVDEDGQVLNPYQTLKTIFAADTIEAQIANLEITEVVNEGCAAMKAYYDMMYGDPGQKELLKNQLLRYCELDTMAMVMIWTHWLNGKN